MSQYKGIFYIGRYLTEKLRNSDIRRKGSKSGLPREYEELQKLADKMEADPRLASFMGYTKRSDWIIRNLEGQVKKNNNDVETCYALAYAYYDAEMIAESQTILRHVLQLKPNHYGSVELMKAIEKLNFD